MKRIVDFTVTEKRAAIEEFPSLMGNIGRLILEARHYGFDVNLLCTQIFFHICSLADLVRLYTASKKEIKNRESGVFNPAVHEEVANIFLQKCRYVYDVKDEADKLVSFLHDFL